MKTQPLEWDALWAAMEENPEAWIETTESMYFEMLCVLPPRAMRYESFLVGEPLRDNAQGETLYSCFCKTGDKFRARNLTVKQFMEMTA